MAFEVARVGDVVHPAEESGGVRVVLAPTHGGCDLVRGPHVEAPFLTLGVRVARGEESALVAPEVR